MKLQLNIQKVNILDTDYKRIQKKFASTNKFKQLEGYVQIQPITQ